VEIRYTFTLDDYKEGNRLFLRHTTLWRKINYYLFARYGTAFGIPLFCVAATFFILNLRAPTYRMGPAVATFTAVIAWVGAILIISPAIYRKKLARYFREQKLPVERILTADSTGVVITRADGAAQARTNWSMFDKGVESATLFVLFQNLRQFIPVPKRAMTPEQQNEFRALLGAHVPGAAGQQVAVS
jgi:YcxB-like protein